MSKYTKSQWFQMKGGFNNHKKDGLITIYATNEDLEIIANVINDKMLHKRTQDFEANAKLIAAAPDLLEACMNIENDDNHIPLPIWDMIQKAIKKATD